MPRSSEDAVLDQLYDQSFGNYPERVVFLPENESEPKVLTTVQQKIVPTNRLKKLFCFVFFVSVFFPPVLCVDFSRPELTPNQQVPPRFNCMGV